MMYCKIKSLIEGVLLKKNSDFLKNLNREVIKNGLGLLLLFISY